MSSIRLLVTQRHLRAAEDEVGDITRRLAALGPAGRMIHRRWMQSETRAFYAGRWLPRKASTLARYRRPGVGSGLGSTRRRVTAPGRRVLTLSGRLRRGLSTTTGAGQLDDSRRTAGGLTLHLGATTRGPLAYAHMLAKRGRDPVSIDEIALDDATDDVTDYILHGRTGRL